MKKIVLAFLIMAFSITTVCAQDYGLQNWTITFFDQEGEVFTGATTVTVYDTGTSNAATLYSNSVKGSFTNPIVSATDLADGTISFWGAAPYYDVQIESSSYTAVVKRSTVRPTKHKIIYPCAEALGNVSAGTITATGAASFEGNVTLGNAVTDNTTVTGAIQGANALYFDGATNNAVETIFAITDPCTSDKTITFPATTGAVVISTLTTNDVDAANSIWGGTSQLIFEGSGVNAYEHTITATNPTADIVWTLPDAGAMTVSFMTSTLATNMPEVANSIWGGTSQLIFEGSAADDYELLLSATNPTADRTVRFADAAGTVMLSSLATNAAEAANSVTGGTNQLIFEGATADDYETILTVTDSTTIDKTITLPNVTGTVLLDTSAIRTGQQYVQTIGYCKVGSTAGWVVPAAADAAHVAALPQSQTASTLIIPITIPLKVGWTITAWTINGQMDSGANTAVLDAKLYKHTEATAGFANAAIGSGMTTLTKTADYKVADGESGLTEVVAADESYYLLVTGTTAATTDIEIAGITVTVSEL